MTSRVRAIGGLVCLVLLLGACGSSKKADASKVKVQGKLSAEDCQKVQSAVTTLGAVPDGSVSAADAKTASTDVSSAVGADSTAMRTVLVAVSVLGDVPPDQLKATVSSVTSGGGYATALGKVKDAIDKGCS
jgi:hypothetical protein